ncbi:hypothetical protein TRVL_02651 [Trypanosoma vivax]|nr:hypothetical protein TRVL_02651 [Trypanosoma vivax]
MCVSVLRASRSLPVLPPLATAEKALRRPHPPALTAADHLSRALSRLAPSSDASAQWRLCGVAAVALPFQMLSRSAARAHLALSPALRFMLFAAPGTSCSFSASQTRMLSAPPFLVPTARRGSPGTVLSCFCSEVFTRRATLPSQALAHAASSRFVRRSCVACLCCVACRALSVPRFCERRHSATAAVPAATLRRAPVRRRCPNRIEKESGTQVRLEQRLLLWVG